MNHDYIGGFLTYLEENQNEYYKRCNDAALDITNAFKIGVYNEETGVNQFGIPNSDTTGGSPDAYAMDMLPTGELLQHYHTNLDEAQTFLNTTIGSLRANAARKSALSFKEIKRLTDDYSIKTFFDMSIFKNLGEVDDLNVATERFLQLVAPDTPTIDDVYVLTSMQIPSDGLKRVLAVKCGNNTTPIPLFFCLRPGNNDKDAKAGGLLTLHETNHESMVNDEHIKMPFLKVSTSSKKYVIPIKNNTDTTEFTSTAYVATFQQDRNLNNEFFQKLHMVTVTTADNDDTNQVFNFQKYNGEFENKHTKSATDNVIAQNKLWKQYKNAIAAWQSIEYSSPHTQFMADLVLLDLSRFGYAPCWSTPLDMKPQNEDTNAGTFKNDIAEFTLSNHDRALRIKYNAVSSQKRPQWKCAKFLHSKEFYQLRRRAFLRTFMNSNNEGPLIATFKVENKMAHDWANATGTEYDNQRKMDRELFCENVEMYTMNKDNDIAALCICFTATQIRLTQCVRIATDQLSFPPDSPPPDSPLLTNIVKNMMRLPLFTIRNMKLLAFKAMSVPAHETLKYPTRSWVEDTRVLGTVLKTQMNSMEVMVGNVATERQELVSAFINSVNAKRLAADSQKPGFKKNEPRKLIQSSIPCAAALYGFDRPVLCARVRILFPTQEARDAALKILTALSSGSFDADQLMERYKSRTGNDHEFVSANKEAIKTFVFTYTGDKINTIPGLKPLLVKLYVEWTNGTLEAVWQQRFVCETALDKVITNAIATLEFSDDKLKLLRYKRTVTSKQPLVFKNEQEPEICMVAEIDISQLSHIVRSNMTTTDHHLPADVELDKLLWKLSKTCPQNAPPNQCVQHIFRELSNSTTLDVVRFDWWIGNATNHKVDTYDDASYIVPGAPFALIQRQLITHDSQLPMLSEYMNSETTPFDGATATAQSIKSVKDAVDFTLKNFNSPAISEKALTDIFSNETNLELQPIESLGRVCRIAFELLKGNGFGLIDSSTDDPSPDNLRVNNYNDIVQNYFDSYEAKVSLNTDQMAWLYGNVSTKIGKDEIGNKRSANALRSGHRDAFLVPYQHSLPIYYNEKRHFYIDTSIGNNMFVYQDTSNSLIRFLQLRISTSSYAMMRLRLASRNLESFQILRGEFQLVLQEATRYHTDSLQKYTESDKGMAGPKSLAKFLFPAELQPGRTNDDISNFAKNNIATNAIPSCSQTASMYMATAVSTLKQMQVFEPAKLVDENFKHLTDIMREMASIADGLTSVGPFLRFLVNAAESLKGQMYMRLKQNARRLQRQTQPLLDEFSINHAKFHDSMRSYADVASSGFLNLGELEERFLEAYESVRTFKKRYTRGPHGMLVFLANQFNNESFRLNTMAIIKPAFAAIERLITSELFNRTKRKIKTKFQLNSTLQNMFPSLDTYTVLAARFNMNSALGCVTAASPFRDMTTQIDNPLYRQAIRESNGFDTMNGFLNDNGQLASFHCFLPTASEIFQDGIREQCSPYEPEATNMDCEPSEIESSRKGNVRANKNAEGFDTNVDDDDLEDEDNEERADYRNEMQTGDE